jgi:hypothetical protein
VQNNFVRPLEPGEYAFWVVDREVSVRIISRIVPNPDFPDPDFPWEEVLIEQHPEFVATYCQLVQLQSQQVAIARY